MEPIGDLCRMIEMFVQGVDVLENAASPADDKVVDCNDVLGVFRKRNATNVLEYPTRNQYTANIFNSRPSSVLIRCWIWPTGCSGM